MEGRASVFDDIRQLQHYASSLAFNQITAPTTVWNQQQDTVWFQGIQVKVSSLVSGMRHMLKDLNHKMHDLSGGRAIRYTIPDDYVDDLSTTARGRSWLQTSYTEPKEHALMHAMCKEGCWNLNRVNSQGDLTWSKPACEEFMHKVGDIVDLIITLAHIGAGPPVRGEELIRDQITNGIQPRTIYLCFGRLMAIRRHSKDTNARGIDPFNVCYFPQGLTDAICYYLLVVRPLERVVAQYAYADGEMVERYDRFLYVKHGKRFTSDQLSDTLRKVTKKHMGVGLSLRPLRHIMIAFKRAYVEEFRVQRGDDIGDLLSSHTSRTADTRYAREEGMLEGATETRLLDIYDWCELYHNAVGLGERIGPLFPLRLKRKLANQLTSMPLSDHSGGRTMDDAIATLLAEYGARIYRSVIDDLKPYLSIEVRQAIGDAMECLVEEREVISASRPSGDTPLEQSPSAEARDPPQPFPFPPESAGNRRATRAILSDTYEPATKRRETVTTNTDGTNANRVPIIPSTALSPQINCIAGADTYDDFADIDLDKELADFGDVGLMPIRPLGGTSPLQDPNPPVCRSLPLLSGYTGPGIQQEATMVDTPSPINPRPREVEGHTGLPGPSRARGRLPRTSTMAPLRSEITGALRTLRGDPNADFKSDEQRMLVESVMERKYTVGVLPTGGGKSLAYEIPPICTGQVTIVACPFKVIVSQALRKCKERGLAVERWGSQDVKDVKNTRLVVMTVEALVHPTMSE
jgi:hypothetical protein